LGARTFVSFYQSIKDQLELQRPASVIGGAHLNTCLYTYDLALHGEAITKGGRCQVLIGRGLFVLWDPRTRDGVGWTVDEVAAVQPSKRGGLLGRPAMVVTTATGHAVTLVQQLSGRAMARVIAAIDEAFPMMGTVAVLDGLGVLLNAERRQAGVVARREAAAELGDLTPEDAKGVLGAEPVAHGRCIYLGSAAPPEAPEGPAYQAFAIAGETRFGFLRLPIYVGADRLMFENSFTYEEIECVGYRAEEDVGSWLVEIVTKPKHLEVLHVTFPYHHAVRLPAPAILSTPNVTDAILTRLEGKLVPEAKATGMVLLPITKSPTPDKESEPNGGEGEGQD
jgi:hypothetical protein